MLLVRGEAVNYKDTKDPYVILINKYRKLLEKQGAPWIFKFDDRLFKTTENGQIETPGAKRLATSVVFSDENGSEEITYCRRYWFDKEGMLKKEPNKIIIDKTLHVSKNDWDLAVYLRYFYPNYGYSFKLVDEKAKNEATISNAILETKVRTYIHTPDLVDFSEAKLRSIAGAYGIYDKQLSAVQNLLWDTVKNEQELHGRGFFEFERLVEQESYLNIKTNVVKAINKDIIRNYTDDSSWSYVTAEGKGAAIVQYTNPANALGELLDHLSLKRNKNVLSRLVTLLGADAVEI